MKKCRCENCNVPVRLSKAKSKRHLCDICIRELKGEQIAKQTSGSVYYAVMQGLNRYFESLKRA